MEELRLYKKYFNDTILLHFKKDVNSVEIDIIKNEVKKILSDTSRISRNINSDKGFANFTADQ